MNSKEGFQEESTDKETITFKDIFASFLRRPNFEKA